MSLYHVASLVRIALLKCSMPSGIPLRRQDIFSSHVGMEALLLASQADSPPLPQQIRSTFID